MSTPITIALSVNGTTHQLTVAEAKALQSQLNELLGTTDKHLVIPLPLVWQRDVTGPAYPMLPPAFVPPFTVTCGSGNPACE